MISLLTIILSFSFFLLAIAIHLIRCRLSPHKGLKAKLFVIIAMQLLCLFLIIALIFHLALIVTSVVIYLLLIPAYLIFYVSSELVSPSKRMLRVVEDKEGASYADMYKALERENLIMTRLEELVDSHCVVIHRENYQLSPSGALIARFLAFYQLLLGRKMGG